MKNLKKLMALLLCAAMLVGAAAGCNKTEETQTDKSTETQTTTTPPEEKISADEGEGNVEKDELVVALNAEMGSLDPLQNWVGASYYVYWTVYDRLTQLNPVTNEYEPQLAESWEVSDDGLCWTFHLRQGVKWHDGTPFTAKDVVYTVHQGVELSTGNYPSVDHAEAADDYTVKIYMTEPNSVFLDKQWTGDCCIVKDGSTVEERSTNPMGTGPFKFVEWVSGDHITIEANEDFWGEKPGTKKITFPFIPEANARLVALQAGDLDVADVDPAAIDHVTSDENLILLSTESAYVNYLAFNNAKGPFTDINVRKACCYAIDREAIVLGQVDGQGKVARSTVSTTRPGAVADWEDDYEVDLDKAKELLAQSEYPNGFECTLGVLSSQTLAAQLIQADLAKIGITVNVNEMDSATKNDADNNGDLDLSICGRSAGATDAYLNMYMTGKAGNKPHYSNPKYDEVMKKSWVTMDFNERNKIYEEAQTILHEDAASFPLWTGLVLMGADKDIKSLTLQGSDGQVFRTAYIGH